MAEATAKIRNVRVSPKKLVLLCNAIKGKEIEDARWILNSSGKGSVEYFLHALSNAGSILKEKGASQTNIFIKNATVDQGSRLKRHRAGARGYSNVYTHAMSHLTIIVSDDKKPGKKDDKKELDDIKEKKVDNKKTKSQSKSKGK